MQRSSIRSNRQSEPRALRASARSCCAPTPKGATVPRERSYNQLVARRSLPSKENSWRFRIDPAYVGDSALPTGQRDVSSVDWAKRALVIHGAFCDQPWPGNDSGDDPGLSRTVGSGDTADTAHTVRLPDVLLCRSFPVIREIII